MNISRIYREQIAYIFVSMEEMSENSKRSELDMEDYYRSEEGYIVFTEQYHLKRGYCCKSGCKHCPYDFKEKMRRGEID